MTNDNRPENSTPKSPAPESSGTLSQGDMHQKNAGTSDTEPHKPQQITGTPVESSAGQSAHPPAETTQAPDSLPSRGEGLNRKVLMVMLIGLGLTLIPMLRIFIVPVVLAATFATLFYPVYRFFLKLVRKNKAVSASLSCLVLIVGLLVPTYILIHLVTVQAIELYSSTQPKIRKMIAKGERGAWQEFRDNRIVKRLRLDRIDLENAWREGMKTAGRVGSILFDRMSAGVTGILGMVTSLIITIFTMFYFFMDGEEFVRRLRYLSPLRRDYEDMILSRFLLISRATIKGTLLIGVMQGSLGGITLFFFGINTWLIWGFVMVILSIIPMVGCWLVMLPAAAAQIVAGNLWQGIGIALVSTVVISNLDNFVRPRLVGRDAKMHDLMIFFSTLGGIAVFGIMGFIIGPVIAALFITVLEIYGLEFKSELESPYTTAEG
ncbi:MAG: AI-2E family transporter [Chitinivibrionales bacterium]|nr:AI-2E family transporter [Chitinivibrionales bacterium]